MTQETKVLYNASCPVCAFEINHYARYAGDNQLPVRFDDLNSDALSDWNLSAQDAARRLHVLQNGQLLSGIPAFIALWREMPRYSWLARLVSLPGIYRLACIVYDHLLAPALYAWHRRRTAKMAA